MVVKMWISEGFVHGSSNALEELGEQYFNELILRNLLEPVDKYTDHSACTMHEVIRAFAHYVSRDEAVIFHKGHTESNGLESLKIRRLFVEMETNNVSGSDELNWSALEKKSLRTLMLDGGITFKLNSFSSLRTLHIVGAKIDAFIESLCQLKHLRFLRLVSTDISRLPEAISSMKFLQFITLSDCENTVQMPGSIIKLRQLRCFELIDTKISGIPRGFGGLTNLKSAVGFPAHIDLQSSSPKSMEDWCSLQELGPMHQLGWLELNDLENVSASSFARKANLATKEHLTYLNLACTSRLGDDGLVLIEEDVSQEEKKQIEDVFDELCPPPCLDKLSIEGYFLCRFPSWMMLSTSVEHLERLRFLFLKDLACCTELPDGLCQIPNLEFIQIDRSPAIKHVGPSFVQAKYYHHGHHPRSKRLLTFPRLCKLFFLGMVEWEEWEWEVQANVQAMPFLEELRIHRCKLRCIPRGLTFHATSLRKLVVSHVEHLESLESFTSVTDLKVEANPNLARIVGLPKLQKLSIIRCPNLKVLDGTPALLSLKLEADSMDTLPEYLRQVNPRRLVVDCSLGLLTSLAMVNSSPEWDKISHIRQFKAYAEDGERERGRYFLYNGDPNNIDTNVSRGPPDWPRVFFGDCRPRADRRPRAFFIGRYRPRAFFADSDDD